MIKKWVLEGLLIFIMLRVRSTIPVGLFEPRVEVQNLVVLTWGHFMWHHINPKIVR